MSVFVLVSLSYEVPKSLPYSAGAGVANLKVPKYPVTLPTSAHGFVLPNHQHHRLLDLSY